LIDCLVVFKKFIKSMMGGLFHKWGR
jgi:hypothetical protein